MAVYKSQRAEAAAEYITAAKKLRIMTITNVSRFPKSYRWIVTNKMLELAADVYSCSMQANKIYVNKDMNENDYELRHRYLMKAASSTSALLGEISFCWDMVSQGNNFFSGKADYAQMFQRWIDAGLYAQKKLQGVMDSDKKRWNGFHKD